MSFTMFSFDLQLLKPLYFFTIIFCCFIIVKWALEKYLKYTKEKTKTTVDDFIHSIVSQLHWSLLLSLSIIFTKYMGFVGFSIPHFIHIIALTVVMGYLGVNGGKIVRYLLLSIFKKRKMNEGWLDFLVSIIKYSIYGIAFLFFLSNLGVDISAIIAGLGVGGIAIALAAQNVLGDLFASISFYFDKPFEVGHDVQVDNEIGTVKKIGIKSTRIQLLRGEEMIYPNQDLAKARIRNFKKMKSRRIVMNMNVTYETKTAQLKKIPDMMKSIVESQENSEFVRIRFKKLGDFSLQFQLVFLVASRDYDVYLAIRENINYAVMDAFEAEGIEFAYPTQKVFIEREA